MTEIILDHNKVNLTFITDIHLADRAPGRRRDNYKEAILSKLRFASDLTSRVKGICLCGGDLFHRKLAAHNSHSLVEASIQVLKTFPTSSIYGVVGNHDIIEDRLDSVPRQPLGVLQASHVYTSVTDPITIFSQDKKIGVQVIGFDYRDTEDTLNAIKYAPKLADDMYKVAIIHQMSGPGADRDFFGEKLIGYDSLTKYGFDVVLWGHDHSYIKPTLVGRTHHLHYGSLSRASLSSDEVDRNIIIPVISFNESGLVIKEISVPITPLEACFTTADISVKKVSKSSEVVDFLSDLEDKVSEVESEDPTEILEALCNDEAVKDLVKEYCEL